LMSRKGGLTVLVMASAPHQPSPTFPLISLYPFPFHLQETLSWDRWDRRDRENGISS
jgi:hypothetical protein